MKYLELDLLKIKKLGEIRGDENFRFRAYLKGQDGKKIDKIVHRLHKEITQRIDCTTCGNCCNELRPSLSDNEMEYLSEIDNISKEDFVKNFTEKEEYEEKPYLKEIPCRYLDGKECSIYEKRPEECKSYPHTHKSSFISRTWGIIDNYEICPIVFNLYERLKQELHFRQSITF